MSNDLSQHWNTAYKNKGERGVSWFEESPELSVDLIASLGLDRPSVVDVGGGASRLVDTGLARGWEMAVLDLAERALEAARQRLGAPGSSVEWIASDVRTWQPSRQFDVWHDRAAFHFLTLASDRAAYVERLATAVKPRGTAIIATFALDGPERCSGLEVVRYDSATLASVVGSSFELVDERRDLHTTPWGSTQAFQFSVFRRNP